MRVGRHFEWLAGGAVVVLGLLAVWRLVGHGYLPQPFYFRVDQTFMDLFSSAYWANNGAAYITWHSLYPPLSFVFLEIFSIHKCYEYGDIFGRHCDWRSLLILVVIFAGNIFLVYRAYGHAGIGSRLPRTIAVGLGLPMLYALERGNLLIPCFTCFVLAFSDLLKWPAARWLAMALSINFKPYLVFSVVPFLVRRAWLGVGACAVLFAAIYGLTYLAEGSGSPLEVIANESHYAAAKSDRFFTDLYYATSYWPLIRLLEAAPTGLVLAPAGWARLVAVVLEILIRGAQIGVTVCLVAAAFRPTAVDVRRFGALVAAISLTAFTTGSSGYAQIFLLFLLFYEPWRGPVRIAMLMGAFLLCLPIDYAFRPVVHGWAHSYLGERDVMVSFGVSVGQLVRPGILLVIQYGLIGINLSDLIARRRGGFSDGEAAPCVAAASANR